MEIWPAIDVFDGKVVRLVRGQPSNKIVYSDNPVNVALEWEKKNVTGLHVIDLNAALGLGNNRKTVQEICEKTKLPVQFGGGLHDIKDIEEAFNIGVKRVILGSAILTGKLNAEDVLSFGKDKIIVALDHKNGKVAIDGWKRVLNMNICNAIRDLWAKGFRLFLSTNIQSDGTLNGINVKYLKSIEEFLNQTYIAGGISSIADIIVLKKLKVKGIVLGRALYDKIISMDDVLEVVSDDSC